MKERNIKQFMTREEKLKELGFKKLNAEKTNVLEVEMKYNACGGVFGKRVNKSLYIINNLYFGSDKKINVFLDVEDLENEDRLKEVINTLRKDYEEFKKLR